MASNNELRAQIVALATELKLEQPATDGLKNDELTKLVSDLEAKRPQAPAPGAEPPPSVSPAPAAGAQPPATGDKPAADAPVIDGASDGSIGGPPVPAPRTLEQRYPFQIALNKSILTGRGMLNEGDEIRAADVGGGEARLAELVADGFVTAAAKP